MASSNVFLDDVVFTFNEKSQIIKLFFFLHLFVEIADYFFLIFKSHSPSVDKRSLEIAV